MGSVHFHSKTILDVINFQMEPYTALHLEDGSLISCKCTQSFMITFISHTHEQKQRTLFSNFIHIYCLLSVCSQKIRTPLSKDFNSNFCKQSYIPSLRQIGQSFSCIYKRKNDEMLQTWHLIKVKFSQRLKKPSLYLKHYHSI